MVKLQVKNSRIHGKGLFAKEAIPWGTRIIEYKGKIISDKEAERRTAQGADYIFELGKNKNIDGDDHGSDARFINHSRTKPNCFILREKGEIWLVAGVEGIKKGEELFFDYGSGYYPLEKK